MNTRRRNELIEVRSSLWIVNRKSNLADSGRLHRIVSTRGIA
jgi:hypothetical protein